MNSVFGRFRLFFGFVGLLSATSMEVVAVPIVALRAVAINGSSIAPTNSISVVPGDTITAELFLSDWTTSIEALRSYQTGLSRNTFVSGARGALVPFGWDAPVALADAVVCASDEDCVAEFPFCDTGAGFCVGLNHDPSQGVFIDATRADFVFMNPNTGVAYPHLASIDFRSPILRYGALVLSPSDARTYSIPPKYAGTLKLRVSDDACGRFRLILLQGDTELIDQSDAPIPFVQRQPLIVMVTSPGFPADSGQCSCLNIVATDIPNCTIDGRQPTDPDGTNNRIPRSVTFTFDCADTTGIASISNFTRSFSPSASLPVLASATSSGSDVRVSLTGPMREQSWNCITFNATGEGVCLGIMPGDVNSDARSQSFGGVGLNDISALEDCLNNPGTCTLFQCDINRSGVCGPHDLLREIDLLVGTGAFMLYDGKKIADGGVVVACPLAPAP